MVRQSSIYYGKGTYVEFRIDAKEFYNMVQKVKKATASQITEKIFLLEAGEVLRMASSGNQTYATGTIECQIIQTGAETFGIDSFDYLQYIEGLQHFKLKGGKLVHNKIKINATSKPVDFDQTPPTTYTVLDSDVFSIIGIVDSDDTRFTSVFINGSMIGTADGFGFGSFHNSADFGDKHTIPIEALRVFDKRQPVQVAFDRLIWLKQGNFIMAYPSQTEYLPTVLGFSDYEPSYVFKISKQSLLNLLGIVDSFSMDVVNSVGCGTLSFANGKLVITPKGNQLGEGEFEIDVEGSGEMEIGISTRRVRSLLNALGGHIINIGMGVVANQKTLQLYDDRVKTMTVQYNV